MTGPLKLLPLVLAACGSCSGSPKPARTVPVQARPVQVEPGLTEDECRGFFKHLIDVQIRERYGKDGARAPKAEQDRSAVMEVLETHIDLCVGGSRRDYNCALGSKSSGEIEACVNS